MNTGFGGGSGICTTVTSSGGVTNSGSWYSGVTWLTMNAKITTWNAVESPRAAAVRRLFLERFKGCSFLAGRASPADL